MRNRHSTRHSFKSYFDAQSYLNGKRRRKLCNNTYLENEDDFIGVLLHSTYVIRFYRDNAMELSSGGWETVTTKDCINSFQDRVSVYSDRLPSGSRWCVHSRSDIPYLFDSGIRINSSCQVIEGVPFYAPKISDITGKRCDTRESMVEAVRSAPIEQARKILLRTPFSMDGLVSRICLEKITGKIQDDEILDALDEKLLWRLWFKAKYEDRQNFFDGRIMGIIKAASLDLLDQLWGLCRSGYGREFIVEHCDPKFLPLAISYKKDDDIPTPSGRRFRNWFRSDDRWFDVAMERLQAA
jgi:hypothetical protein